MKWRILLALVAALAIMASGAYADTLTGSSGGFQPYPSPLTYNNIPYWDGASSDGTHANIGNFLTATGYFSGDTTLTPPLSIPQWFGNPDTNGTAATTMSFTPTNPNGSISGILIEVAAYSGTNTFGWYLASDPGTRHELFAGSDSAGDISATFTPGGAYGFYIGVGSGSTQTYYYMDSTKNSSDKNYQHFAIFQDVNNYPGDFFIGCEDLPIGSFCGAGDKDFQDMVIKVSPNPVPLPPSVLLLGSGLLGLLVLRRSKR